MTKSESMKTKTMSYYDTTMTNDGTTMSPSIPGWNSSYNTMSPSWSGKDCGGWSMSRGSDGSGVGMKYS